MTTTGTKDKNTDNEHEGLENQEEQTQHVSCCLCYCAVDYSDKSYFCQEARDADSDLEGEQPLLLPIQLYDPNNALVFCDSCDRSYHQRCHFVPVIHLPRGTWNCFICTTASKVNDQPSAQPEPKQRSRRKKKEKPPSQQPSNHRRWTTKQINKELYQMDKPAGAMEVSWEYDVRGLKVSHLKTEMRRLQGAISQQMQNIRLSQMTLKTFTTSRRKTSVESMLNSQELCQSLFKMSSAKLRVRQLLQSLETYMKGDDKEWDILMQFLKQNPKESATWFPFVRNVPRRLVPRLKDAHDDYPETCMSRNNSKAQQHDIKDLDSSNIDNLQKKKQQRSIAKHDENINDDDSGISLDNLKCCVCFNGDATDDNDLILCDGQDCFRAHHMHCHYPVITEEDLHVRENQDWFCPLCTALAKFVADVQSEYTGDDWYCEDDEKSVASWDCVNDVFPEAPEEYAMATKWKRKTIDRETKAFLTNYFGFHEEHHDQDDDQNGRLIDGDDEDDEDFDPNDPDTELGVGADDNNHDSDSSSVASLGEVCIELNIGRQELEALSGGESSDDNTQSIVHGNNRRSKRIRSTLSSRTVSLNNTDDEQSGDIDVGILDERNIIDGKRRRRKIDYALLNDSMFGKLSAKDRAAIDDDAEFHYKPPAKRDTSSETDDSGNSSDADESRIADGDDKSEEEHANTKVSAIKNIKAMATRDNAEQERNERLEPSTPKVKHSYSERERVSQKAKNGKHNERISKGPDSRDKNANQNQDSSERTRPRKTLSQSTRKRYKTA